MATFKPHYNLCALLGAHNLVGISSDKDENTILATLSPNVVVKHKLTDQKPLKSWSTRQSNSITSTCIYDSNSDKYAGVINKKYICLWGDDDTNLEDVKKYMFTTDVYAILGSPGKPSVVLFSNGYSESLELSLTRRKDEKPSLLSSGEVICKAYLENIKDQSILVICSKKRVYLVRLANDGTPFGNFHFDLLNPNDQNCQILATTVVSHTNITLVALWSDGSLIEYSEKGATIATHTLKGISLTSPVVMATLDATHIAIYGADASEEGALLNLFDLKFGLTVATRRLKVFCDPPHLYCHSTNGVLLLCIIQNLVVVPYVLKPSLLWNLVSGQQQNTESRSKPNIVAWDQPVEGKPQIPFSLSSKTLNEVAISLWESNASTPMLFEELLPALKEEKDLNGICSVLSHVKDLPEQWLAEIMNFSLEQIKSYDEIHDQPNVACLLNILLALSYCDAILVNHIRRRLTTTSTIKLLRHLHNLSQEVMWVDYETCKSKPNIHQIVDWISLILDAHHNELLIIGENDEIQQLLRNLESLVAKNCEFLDSLGHSEALIKLLESKKRPPENRRKDWYAIEVVRLL